MKKIFYIFLSFVEIFYNTSCSEYKFDEEGLMAATYAYVLDSLASASKVLDSDIESLRAYSEAKKQIDTAIVLLDKSDYLGGYSRIWSASSYITYGISYTKTISNNYPLKELGSNIIQPISGGLDTEDLWCKIDEQEEKAISGWVYYYKVSGTPDCEVLEDVRLQKEKSRTKILSSHDPAAAHRLLQVENLNYGFKVYSEVYKNLYTSLQLALNDSIDKKIDEWDNSTKNINSWNVATMPDSAFNEIYLIARMSNLEMISYIAEAIIAYSKVRKDEEKSF